MRKKLTTRTLSVLGAVGVGVGTFGAVPALAAEELVEEVVTIGTRAKGRTVVDTPVPVDVFNMEQIESVNSSDLTDIINTLVPSFNVGREPISDGASFVRPPQLRGLDSDKTLVLVNGKRRHRAALVLLGGFGSHGPDLGAIPAIALSSAEVLRDGASAQYGSDAIAGVLNFNLRDDAEGFEFRGRWGQYQSGDGDDYQIDANAGFPLTDNGFINISANYGKAEPTSRSQPYDISIGDSGLIPSEAALVGPINHPLDGQPRFGPDAFFYQDFDGDGIPETPTLGSFPVVDDLGNPVLDDNGDQVFQDSDGIPDDLSPFYAENLRVPEQIWGQPQREQYSLVLNSGIELSDSMSVYAFGNYSYKEQEGGFFHRRPGVSQLLPVRLADGSIYDPRADGFYPAGFTPQFGADVTDYSIVAGIEGFLDMGLTYDISTRYGNNEIEYQIRNTMNPSMGPDSPKSFKPGDLVTDEWAINADFTYPVELDGLASPLNIGFGAEFRNEGYEIQSGDPDSFLIGTFAQQDPFGFNDPVAGTCSIPGTDPLIVDPNQPCPAGDPIFNALPIGSNGFPGYGPGAVSDFDRDSYAFYVDFEADITEKLLANVATRYEDYDQFGDNITWKVAARYMLTENVNIRGSVGTGFRAPTPGQISTINTSTRIAPDGTPVAEGIFPADSAAASVFGGAPLDSEDSFQWTLGFTATPLDSLTLTVDYYYIELTDRIVLSSDFEVTPTKQAELLAAGVANANDLAQLSFFSNDLDSETQGIDIVATWDIPNDYGLTQISASFNWNDTQLKNRPERANPLFNDPDADTRDQATVTYVNDEDVYDEENGLPSWRSVVTGRHTWNQFGFMVRANLYGSYENAANSTLANTQTFAEEIFVDAEASWNINENYTVTIGGQNLFDNFPDRGTLGESCCGRIYRSDSVAPWQGAFYFLRASANF